MRTYRVKDLLIPVVPVRRSAHCWLIRLLPNFFCRLAFNNLPTSDAQVIHASDVAGIWALAVHMPHYLFGRRTVSLFRGRIVAYAAPPAMGSLPDRGTARVE